MPTNLHDSFSTLWEIKRLWVRPIRTVHPSPRCWLRSQRSQLLGPQRGRSARVKPRLRRVLILSAKCTADALTFPVPEAKWHVWDVGLCRTWLSWSAFETQQWPPVGRREYYFQRHWETEWEAEFFRYLRPCRIRSPCQGLFAFVAARSNQKERERGTRRGNVVLNC